jgi:hypothetical protein
LQQRWQSESQAVPLDRKQAQKLWDAFRLPLDEAFARKSQARTLHAQALSAHDQQVMQAAEQLEAAVAKGDAMAIREAMQQLSQAASQPIQAQEAAAPKTAPEPANAAPASDAAADTASDAATDAATDTATEPPTEAVAPKPVKKLIAVRGDDRPGQKKTEVAAPVRGGKPGMGRPDRGREGSGAMGARHFREDARSGLADRGPRLGDAAFRAQRQALEHAQAALKKLAMQAHGEVLVHVLSAWQHRQADQLPAAKELGPRLTPVQRQAWVKALQTPAQGDALVALLRLEMAADVNTPAEHIAARRQWQLQWLTQRHEAPPAQTWPSDVATVLQSLHEDSAAQRLQNALRVLMRR